MKKEIEIKRIEGEISHGRKIAENADLIFGWGTKAGNYRAERRASLLITQGEITGGKRVLEIGCGTGIFTEKICRTKAKIIAIDISPELLEKAKEKINASKFMDVDFKVMNVEKMDFFDNEFDCVVGSSILHHLNLEKSILEIKRVLKNGGKIAFAEPNMANPQIIIQKNIKPIKKWLGDSEHETAFFRWSIKRLLEKYGFIDVKVKPFDFLHPFTPQFLIPIIIRIGKVCEKTPIIKEIAGSLLIEGKNVK